MSKKLFDDHCKAENKSKDGIRRLFNVFKPKKTDDDVDGRRNNYIEYTNEKHDYNNLSPEEYLDVSRPYLKDLVNDYSQSGEWKIQLVILNRCVSSTNFEETRFVCSANNNIEIFRRSDKDEVIDKLFDTLLQDFKKHKKHHLKEEANLFLKMLINSIIVFIE